MINDPRPEHGYKKLYTVQYLGNVVGGYPVRYINLSIEELKTYAIKSVKAGMVSQLLIIIIILLSMAAEAP